MLRAAGFLIFRTSDAGIQYLLLQASYGDHHWTPPKGHVDPGENDYETALRETQEEAGLKENDLEIFKDKSHTLSYTVKGNPKSTIYWLAQLKDPTKPITLSDEHTAYEWFDLDNALVKVEHADFCDMLKKMHEEVLRIVGKC